MKYIAYILALLTIGLFQPHQAFAQDVSYSRAMQSLSALNRIPALQNPSYQTEREVLAARVLDNTNRVIGEVEDIIVSDNGSIQSLRVDFDRLRLSGQVFLNYRDMDVKPVSNGFALGFESAQIADMYPRLLSNIETAAGNQGDAVSIRKLNGANLRTANGRKIGEVRNVLFGARGSQAKALFVAMMMGGVGPKQVAIPFNSGAIKTEGQNIDIVVTENQANALRDFTKQMD